MKKAAHFARDAKKGGKHETKTHAVKVKKMGSGKDGRSGSTKRERRLEEESL